MFALHIIFSILTVLALSHAFHPAVRNAAGSTTQLQMGLFDGMFGSKPEPKKTPPKKPDGGGFLDGAGARITIREDEDNAMWIDEPADKKKKSK